MPTELKKAYKYCMDLTRSHYENFPVASLALPRELRQPVSVIYAFARTADDFADEGDIDDATRLERLKDYEHKVYSIMNGEIPDDPIFTALADVISKHELPVKLLHDLLKAFSMDVTVKHYADFDALMYYCRHSANPVGRLLLHLSGNSSTLNLEDSDNICSALQLINFMQDIYQDYHESGRIYIPQEDLQRFSVSEQMLADKLTNKAVRELVMYEIQVAGNMLASGASLGERLGGRFGFEIRMIVLGGMRTVSKLLQQTDDIFTRPRLSASDRMMIFAGAVSKQKYSSIILQHRQTGISHDT